MHYIFSALLLANALLLGYFVMKPKQDAQAQVSLSKPVAVVNQARKIPAEIGKK